MAVAAKIADLEYMIDGFRRLLREWKVKSSIRDGQDLFQIDIRESCVTDKSPLVDLRRESGSKRESE